MCIGGRLVEPAGAGADGQVAAVDGPVAVDSAEAVGASAAAEQAEDGDSRTISPA